MQATKVKQRGERPDMPETASWSCESGCHRRLRSPRRLRTSAILNDTPSSHSSLPSLFCLSSPPFSSLGSVTHLPPTAVIFFFFSPLSDSASVFFPLTRAFVVKMQYSFVFTIRGLQKWRFNTGWIIKPPGPVTGTHSRTPKADSRIDHVATLLAFVWVCTLALRWALTATSRREYPRSPLAFASAELNWPALHFLNVT